jgi:hypothetical protein
MQLTRYRKTREKHTMKQTGLSTLKPAAFKRCVEDTKTANHKALTYSG